MARTGRTWTKFEEIRGVTIAGWRDILREIADEKQVQRERERRSKGYTKCKGKIVKGTGKRFRASPEVSRESRKVGDIMENLGHVAR